MNGQGAGIIGRGHYVWLRVVIKGQKVTMNGQGVTIIGEKAIVNG